MGVALNGRSLRVSTTFFGQLEYHHDRLRVRAITRCRAAGRIFEERRSTYTVPIGAAKVHLEARTRPILSMLLVAQPSNAIPLLPEYSMSCRADDECDHKTNGSSVNDDHADPSLPQKLDVSFSKKVKSRRSFKRLQGLFSGFGNQHKAKAKHGSSSTPTTPLEPPQMVDFALNSTPNGFSNNVKSAASVPSSRPTSPVPSPSLSRKMPTVTAQANLKKALGLKRKTRSAKTLTSLWSPSPQVSLFCADLLRWNETSRCE